MQLRQNTKKDAESLAVVRDKLEWTGRTTVGDALEVVGAVRVACKAIIGWKAWLARSVDTVGALLLERDEVQFGRGLVLLHGVMIVCDTRHEVASM